MKRHHHPIRNVGPAPRSTRWPATIIVLLVAVLCACAGPSTNVGTNRPPEAAFISNVTTGPAPLSVAFDATSSRAPDGVIVTFTWVFGDGATGAGATTAHTYASAGSFEAVLTVTDDRGATASATRTITVTNADGHDDDDNGGDGSDGSDDDNGGDGSDDDNGSDGDDGDPGVGLDAAGFAAAYAASEAAFELPRIAGSLAIDMAITATELSGVDPTLTGTLTETDPGVYAYAPDPSDRLRADLLDGRSFDAAFDAVPEGNFSDGGSGYLRRPHRLDVRLTSNAGAGALDLAIASQPASAANTQAVSLVGAFTAQDGHRWSVDLAGERYDRSVVEFGGNERESITAFQGEIGSASADVVLTANRYSRYILVNTVENVDHRFDHGLATAGRSYRFAGRVFVGFRDSRPADRDQWVIAGTLTEDDVVIAQVTATEDVSGLTIWLDFGGDVRQQLLFFGYL